MQPIVVTQRSRVLTVINTCNFLPRYTVTSPLSSAGVEVRLVIILKEKKKHFNF